MDVKKKRGLHNCWEECKQAIFQGEHFEIFLKKVEIELLEDSAASL